MSLVKVKQLAASVSPFSVIVTDPTTGKAVWSNSINSGLLLPAGNDAARPSTPVSGIIRYNTTLNKVEVYNGTLWEAVGGGDASGASRIQDEDGSTYVDTEHPGDPEKVVIGAKSKPVVFVEGSDASATAGEKFILTHIDDEVQIKSANTAGTDDVDIRLIPQGLGHVYMGIFGDGVIETDPTFNLIVRGGQADSTTPAGHAIVSGGSSAFATRAAGDLILRAGLNTVNSTLNGTIRIEDPQNRAIVRFVPSPVTIGAANFLEIGNGASNGVDINETAVKIGVSDLSGAANVDVIWSAKGEGLIRIADSEDYIEQLQVLGNYDAFVTKGYLIQMLGSETGTINAGVGLTNNMGTFDVNATSDTIGVDTANALIVKSNDTLGHILQSTGDNTEAAEWGPLNLGIPGSITGTLSVSNGGTGLATLSPGAILIGNNASVSELQPGLDNMFVGSNGSVPSYQYIGALRGTNGKYTVRSINGLTTDANLTVSVPDSLGDVIIGIESEGRTDVNLTLAPLGAGYIRAPLAYTDSLTVTAPDEALVTKLYVDNLFGGNTDSPVRRAVLTSGWASTMNIGAQLPSAAGKTVGVTNVSLTVVTPMTGNVQARVVANGTLMDIHENDLSEAGTYVCVLPGIVDQTGTQVVIQFVGANGTTPVTPSAGSIAVTVEYIVV